MLIYFFVRQVIFGIIFKELVVENLKKLAHKCDCCTQCFFKKEDDLEEMELPTFINVLDGEQQMSWFTQELYDRQSSSVGLKALRPKQLKMLSKVKRDYQESNDELTWVSKIYGVYNYDILSNPEYATAMGYEHPADRINFGGKYDFLDEHNDHNQGYYFKKIWFG